MKVSETKRGMYHTTPSYKGAQLWWYRLVRDTVTGQNKDENTVHQDHPLPVLRALHIGPLTLLFFLCAFACRPSLNSGLSHP